MKPPFPSRFASLSVGSLLLVLSLPGFLSAAAQPQLLMHLKLDEDPASNTTTLIDSSGNNNSGTVINNNGSANKSVPGVNGRALHFDGTADRVDATAFDIDDTFTIAFWANPTGTADGQAFIGKHDANGGNQLVVGIYSGSYHFRIRGTVFNGGTGQVTTGWQHLVVVAESPGTTGAGSTDVTFYKNGSVLWTQTLAAVVGDVAGGRGWTLGQEWDSGPTASDYFTGDLDDVAIWNGALTPEDVTVLHEGGTINVSTYADVIDPNDGVTSLREAIVQANAQPGSNTILLPAGTYPLTETGPEEDASLVGDLDLTDTFGTLTLMGAGRDVTFIDGNAATRILDIQYWTDTVIEGVTFQHGATDAGGAGGSAGIELEHSTRLAVRNAAFKENHSYNSAGAMFCRGSPVFNSMSEVELTEVLFQENTGTYGGAMSIGGNCRLLNVQFLGNRASAFGGACDLRGFANVVRFWNCLFVGNSADSGFGSGSGGALAVSLSTECQIVGSTLVENVAAETGGGLFNDDAPNASTLSTVHNSILWGNTLTDGTPSQTGGDPLGGDSAFNLIEGEPGALTPLFVRDPDPGDGDWMTTGDNDYGDLHQAESSPSINAGSNPLVPVLVTLDLDGGLRIREGVVDIGAYENQVAGRFRVDQQAAGPVENGLSWETAFTSLHSALAIAIPGDEIWLKADTYTPAGPNGARTASFVVRDGIQVLGGFNGTETDIGQRDSNPDTNGTVLSGDLNGDDDGNRATMAENSYHVVVIEQGASSDTRLTSLTISGGHANGSGVSYASTGGGVLNIRADPTFFRINFHDNEAASDGGAVYNDRGAPIFFACDFYSNSAYNFTSSQGGAVYSYNRLTGKAPSFIGVDFRSNSAFDGGGGLALNESNANLEGVTFSNHFAKRGAGLFSYASAPTLTDVTFNNNTATGSGSTGGGLLVLGLNATIEGSVFQNNSAGGMGGGLAIVAGGATIAKTTFHNNTAASGGAIHIDANSTGFLSEVTFDSNDASTGGAVLNEGTFAQRGGAFIENGLAGTQFGGAVFSAGPVELIDIHFSGNRCLLYGGTVYLGGGVVVNCSFTGGSSQRGAGLYQSEGDLMVVNSTFTSCHASDGGALYLSSALGSSELDQVSMAGCSGAAIHLAAGILNLSNSILWQNRADGTTVSVEGGLTVVGGTSTVANSIIQGSGGSGGGWATQLGTDAGGNLDVDPGFIDEINFDTYPGPPWDLRLRKNSPALQAGLNTALPTDLADVDADLDTGELLPIDLAGVPRVFGASVDMGAFEGGYTTFAWEHPGLDPNIDINNNGFTNFEDYTLGNDPEAIPGFPGDTLEIGLENQRPVLRYVVRGDGVDTANVDLFKTFDFQSWSRFVPMDEPVESETAWIAGDLSRRQVIHRYLNLTTKHEVFKLGIDSGL